MDSTAVIEIETAMRYSFETALPVFGAIIAVAVVLFLVKRFVRL